MVKEYKMNYIFYSRTDGLPNWSVSSQPPVFIKFYWTTGTPIYYMLFMAAFILHRRGISSYNGGHMA